MVLTIQRLKPAWAGVICVFILLLALGSAQGQAPESQVKDIPHPPLENLEKEIFEQLTQGRQTMEKLVANPELDAVNRALAYGRLGHLYHTYEFFDAAQACYYNAALLAPRVYRWNYCMGYILEEKGDMAGALTYYKRARAIQVTPDLVYLINIRIGDCYKALNQLDKAGYSYELAKEVLPDGANILARLGELAFARKNYKKTIEYLEKALEKAPQANKLHYPLAMAYRKTGQMDLAKDHLARRGKVGLQPPDPLVEKLKSLKRGFMVHILDGKKAFSAKRYAEARDAFKRAVAAKPENAGAWVNLGTAQVYLQSPDKGLESFKKALALDPENMTVRYNLGELFIWTGEFDKAIDHLTTYIKASPDDATAHLKLATALRFDSQLSAALAHYKQAIELDPVLPDAWMDLSSLFIANRAFHEAIQILEAGHEALPHNTAIAHQLARYLAAVPEMRLRNAQRALELARKCYDTAPDYKTAKTIGMAYAHMNQCDNAAQWIGKALDQANEINAAETVVKMLVRNLDYVKTRRPCRIP